MGLILPQNVKMKWTASNRPYWTNKGYIFDSYENTFDANVLDLSPVSKELVKVKCDYCGDIFTTNYSSVVSQSSNNHCSKIPCEKCIKLRNNDIQRAISKNKNQILIDDLKNYYDKYGIPQSNVDIKKPMFTYTWYVYNTQFGGDLVDWLERSGIVLNEEDIYRIRHRGGKGNYTKDEAIKVILNMQSKLDRPIMYDDFRYPNEDSIGLTYIKKYWGSMNKMKEELNLEIIQESMIDKQMTIDEIKSSIFNICNEVFNKENRKILMEKDFDNRKDICSFATFRKVFVSNELNIRDYIKALGFTLQRAGNGLNYIFEDKERVVSMNEYEFSNYLRNLGLVYNKDYFRDVRYDKLSTEYKGNMNCDYEIHFQGRIFYVELAGMLGYSKHAENYINNIPINSKSKEKYRLDLMNKKSIFEKENLEYYILLKSEMNEDTYKTILNNTYKEVA